MMKSVQERQYLYLSKTQIPNSSVSIVALLPTRGTMSLPLFETQSSVALVIASEILSLAASHVIRGRETRTGENIWSKQFLLDRCVMRGKDVLQHIWQNTELSTPFLSSSPRLLWRLDRPGVFGH